jgi:formimidoylglutamate deiminase
MAVPSAYLPDALFWEGGLREGLALTLLPDGRVKGVVPAAQAPEGTERLVGRVLLPGLVNGHSHAFQRLIRGATEHRAQGHERDDFWSWREKMYRAAEQLTPEDVYIASRQAFLEMALAGICAVGEFHYLHHQPDGTPYADRTELARQVIRAAREVGLRIALLRVGYARSGHNVAENPRQSRFKDARVEDVLRDTQALKSAFAEDPCVAVGLAPHSVRAVPKPWLQELAESGWDGPLHMHVSEQTAEIDACLAEHGRRPVQLLGDLGLLGPRFTAVHAIHLEDDEVKSLGTSSSFVCACPTTEQNLGDGVIPADHLLNAGARLTLGSDSQATIDILQEARLLEGHLRLVRRRRNVLDPGTGTSEGLATRLFGFATREGARSIGFDTGELAPGKPADVFTVATHHPSLVGAKTGSLLPTLVFAGQPAAIRDVAVNGEWRVRDGRHPLQETSAREFSALVRRIDP